MKAAVYYGPRDIRVEEVAIPSITGDEVLVQVKACGICGSDLHVYRLGLFEDALGRPTGSGAGRIMGHEMSGEVIQVGAQAEGYRVGDRITGVCLGGFAEFATVTTQGDRLYRLPDSISFDEATTMEPFATSVHAVRLANVSAGETVVILGVGIIGLGCIQALRATTDCRIIAVDASPRRLELAEALGADATVDLTASDPVEAVIELTGGAQQPGRFQVRGGNADVVIDCAGAKASPNQGLLMLKQMFGRLVLVALFERQPELDFNQVVRKHVTIHGSWTWTGDDFRQAIALVAEGNVDRKRLISHTFALDDAAEAFAVQDQPAAAVKVLLRPWGE
ncbi:MAG: zinc-binding dehydrogenase [Caldilineaceae bacterium]|nr:zinc-binding dehydrogenase [Caldilineaceae bacterium]